MAHKALYTRTHIMAKDITAPVSRHFDLRIYQDLGDTMLRTIELRYVRRSREHGTEQDTLDAQGSAIFARTIVERCLGFFLPLH